MRSHTYRCPFGATTLRADNAKSLQRKIIDHNIIAHGVRPIIVCSARPVLQQAYDRNAATARSRHTVARPFALSRRGI